MSSCRRCGEPMIETERDEYEQLGCVGVLVKHIVLDECQSCQATNLWVFPTLVVGAREQS